MIWRCAPQDVHGRIPKTVCGRGDFADAVRTLHGKSAPGHPGGPIWSQGSLEVQRLSQLSSEGDVTVEEGPMGAMLLVWKKEEGPPARVWAPVGAGKGKEMDSPLESPGGASPADT